MDRETITKAVAGAWCHPKNQHKVMDVDLANVIINNILVAIQKQKIAYFTVMVKRGANSHIQRLLEMARNRLAMLETEDTEVTVNEPEPDHVTGETCKKSRHTKSTAATKP